MKQNNIERGHLTNRGKGLGTVTKEMVRKRAQELALINGRSPRRLLSSDLAQARRELTGEEGLNPRPSRDEELPESSRWQEVPESRGTKVPVLPASDEQEYFTKLVEEGVEEAEHDQMVRATRLARRQDQV
jgi:hypothetical protein